MRRFLVLVGVIGSVLVTVLVAATSQAAAATADLGVSLTADHSSDSSNPAVAGETVTFTATVTNNGPDDNNGYTLTFDVPSGTSYASITMPSSGTSCSMSAPVVCTSSGITAGGGPDVWTLTLSISPSFADTAPAAGVSLKEHVALSGLTPSDECSNTAPDTQDASVLTVANADLGIRATASPDAHAVAGTVEDYAITVTNNGPSDAVGGYQLTAPLPAGTSLDPASDSTCSVDSDGTTITCDRTTIGTLTPSGTDVFHVKLDLAPSYADSAPSAGVPLTFSPSIGSFGTPQPPDSTGNDSASVPVTVYAEADLGIAVTASPDAHAVAGTVEDYAITVTNNGPSDSVGSYQLTAPLPAGTSLDPTSDSSCTVSGGTITCDRTAIGTLTPSGTDVFHVKLNLAPSYADSAPSTGVSLTFSPSIGSFGTPQPADSTGNDSTSVSVTVYAEADLGIAATASPSGAPPDAHAVAGLTVEDYTITVTNNGPSDAVGGYKATAPLPAGTSLDSNSDSSCSVSDGTITCDRTGIATLTPSGTDVFHVKLDLVPSFSDATSPQATLVFSPGIGSFGTPQPANSTGNDSTSVSVTVYAEADLGVAATASPGGTPPAAHAVAGTVEDYAITVTNNGPSDSVGGYKATAPLPPGTSLASGSDSSCSASGGTITCDRSGIGTLTPSGTDVFHVKLKLAPSYADSAPNAGVSLTFSPSIGSFGTPQPTDSTGNDSTSASVTVYAEADLGIVATASPNGTPPAAHAVAGLTVEDFAITVTNNGPSDSVGGYKATAPLPAGTSLDPTSDRSCSASSGTITCDRTGIGTLTPSGTDVFHVKLDLAPSFGDSSQTDQTPLTLTIMLGSFGTPQPANSAGNDSTSPTITVYSESDLTIAETESTGGPIFANSNTTQNTVKFTITVSNAGPSDAHNVTIGDALNANLLTNATYCQGSGCTATTAYTGSISIGTFAAGGSQTYTIVAHAAPTLGHATANSSPTDYRQPGPYVNSNTAKISSPTPYHSGADSRGPTPAVTTTIDTVPASPTIVQAAVGGNAQAGAEWKPDPSSSNGGQPITGYTLKACNVASPSSCVSLTVGASPNAPAGAPTYFSYVITGLTNGVNYQFTVVATNTVGDSDPANAGTAYASTSAVINTIPSTGTVSADTGISGGALTCTSVTSVNCQDIVASYSFSDKQDIGAIYNLDAEPDAQLLQCLIPATLDPRASGFGTVVNSPDCGPSNKVITDTYPVSANPTPHSEQAEFDSSITTYTRGTPCFAYAVDSTGTAQCTDPSLKQIYTDPNTNRRTNFCPAEFNPSNTTGWSSTKPCAFLYYLVEAIPGYDIICDSTTASSCSGGRPTVNRPVRCDSTDSNCGASAIIGSSSRNGITENGRLLVSPWCDKSLTFVPCVSKYQWLNGDSRSSPKYLDLLITHYQVGDSHLGGSSG